MFGNEKGNGMWMGKSWLEEVVRDEVLHKLCSLLMIAKVGGALRSERWCEESVMDVTLGN